MNFPLPNIVKKRPGMAAIAAIAFLSLAGVALWKEVAFTQAGLPKKEGVVMTRSKLSSTQVNSGNPVVFSVSLTNTSSIPKRVLVDIEIFNMENKRVMQRYWDNVQVIKGKEVAYEVTSPEGLAPGQYKFWVGIFQTEWGKLLNFYDGETFTVSVSERANSTTLYSLVAGNTGE